MKNVKVALIGTPNVGKSTIYNTLTHNHEHTGNWAGKTVGVSSGECVYEGITYTFYDLPGTYSLISKSKEEVVATDFIVFSSFDVAVVVCDATSLEKGIHLVLQTKEICKNVVVCVNLIDEAKKKNIEIDYELLEERLGSPVVPVSARNNIGLDRLLQAIRDAKNSDYLDIDYGVLNKSIQYLLPKIQTDQYNPKWIALKVLENNHYYQEKFRELGILKDTENFALDLDVNLEIVLKIAKKTKELLKNVVIYHDVGYDAKERKIDKILTSKIWGIPIMLAILFVCFYITIVGANYPSSLMFQFFSFIHLPQVVIDLLVTGVYKTLYWVVSVMLPPMLIFFPLFTFLEDLGVLPRIAFNMDRAFSKCRACGKQALTMCMGIGCNAVGVTGARIIDSKRERIIAIITNIFMPCNGKFPTLISIITIFFVGLNQKWGSLLCALILTGFLFLGIILTFLVSFILSKTLLKGEPSSFTLELPPYRMPKILDTIIYSVKNRAIFVLGRAVKVAIPAGVLIWIIANVTIQGVPILNYLISLLNPFGILLGLDGVILLALILGFPANEIVLPIMLMCYLKTNTLIEMDNLNLLSDIFVSNGWTIKTALCFIILFLYRFPCSTTLLTIHKETGSKLYTLLSVIIPLSIGIILCLFIHFIF